MDDDLYKNDGSFFGIPLEPPEQVIARKKEQASTLEAVSVLKELISHLNERIEFREKITSIGVDITDSPDLHQKMCAVNQLLRDELVIERNYIKELLDMHKR